MIRAIYITDSRGATLKLTLVDPYDHGIYVSNIEGLGYPQTGINSSKLSNYDVALFNSQEVSERNVVLTLGLIGAPSVESSRHLLYEYLPIRTPILIEFSTDERTAYVNGYVETIEPDIFNSQEVLQVSIICLDSYFHVGGSKTTYIQNGNTYPNFQFNSWFTDEAKPVGIIEDEMIININSRFQNPPGFALTIHARDGSFDSVTIAYDGGSMVVNDRVLDPYGENIKIDDNLFSEHDDIEIRNDLESVSIKKVSSDGTTTDIMEQTVITNDLPLLKAGNNWFKIITNGIVEIRGYEMLRRFSEPTTTRITDGYHYLYGQNTWAGTNDFWLPDDAYQVRITFSDKSAVFTVNPPDDASLILNDDGFYYFFGKTRFPGFAMETGYVLSAETGQDPEKVDGKHIFDDNGTIIGFYFILIQKSGNSVLRIWDAEIEILNGQTPYEWAHEHIFKFANNNTHAKGYEIIKESLQLEVSEDELLTGYRYVNTNNLVDVVVEHDDIYYAL